VSTIYFLHITNAYLLSQHNEEHDVYTCLTYTKITKECKLLKYELFKNKGNTSSDNGY